MEEKDSICRGYEDEREPVVIDLTAKGDLSVSTEVVEVEGATSALKKADDKGASSTGQELCEGDVLGNLEATLASMHGVEVADLPPGTDVTLTLPGGSNDFPPEPGDDVSKNSHEVDSNLEKVFGKGATQLATSLEEISNRKEVELNLLKGVNFLGTSMSFKVQ